MKVKAIAVKQWLTPEWDGIKFEPIPPKGKPQPYFYVFSISAKLLKKLTGIYRRDSTKQPAEDMGIQRRHDPDRSAEILRYIQDGFPLSRINREKLVDQSEINTLRMPGWLPTAVVVNILTPNDKRGVKSNAVKPDELVKVHFDSKTGMAEIEIPEKSIAEDWSPAIHPIEVIDGQHRLWALEEPEEKDSSEIWSDTFKANIDTIEIPVVAFYGLDRAWQAYLFYTINQLAKRIDISMVFDLYPLLRDQEWLLRFEGPNIYRESRAQDLTMLLWGHQESPWKDRIIRLGGREKGKVAQAAFIRSLMASFIKRWEGSTSRIGGSFGAIKGTHETFLNWGREQQSALLIIIWIEMKNAVIASKAEWAKALNEKYKKANLITGGLNNLLFCGPDTILASDQGVRGIHCVMNDILWVANDKKVINLNSWDWVRKPKHNDAQAISDAISSFVKASPDTMKLIKECCTTMADFDWRLSSALSPNDPLYSRQASYRGSSGYREIRRNIMLFLEEKVKNPLKEIANYIIDALGYEVDEE